LIRGFLIIFIVSFFDFIIGFKNQQTLLINLKITLKFFLKEKKIKG